MKVWTALGSSENELRWRRLSQRLTEAGVPNEFRPWTADLPGSPNPAALAEFAHIRLAGFTGEEFLKTLDTQSSWTTLLGATDGAVRTDRGWWPLCALFEALSQILVARGENLELRCAVLIAGGGVGARAAIAALSRAGYKRFLVTDEQVASHRMLEEVRGRFFGLDFTFVPLDRIVLLPAETSVLVNCAGGVIYQEGEKNLMTELSYLNFLRRPGLLLDLGEGGNATNLTRDAGDAGVEIVGAAEIQARTDTLWAKWAFGVEI